MSCSGHSSLIVGLVDGISDGDEDESSEGVNVGEDEMVGCEDTVGCQLGCIDGISELDGVSLARFDGEYDGLTLVADEGA